MLTERVEQLIADFKRRIALLPSEEREAAIEKMTETLTALNKEASGILHMFKSKGKSFDQKVSESISHYM